MDPRTRGHRDAHAGALRLDPDRDAGVVHRRVAGMRAVLSLALLLAAAAAFADDGRNPDFDFEFGAWTAHISRLVAPLSGSNEWVEYSGTSVVTPVWDGRANLGELLVDGPAGRIEGMSLRVFDPASGQWRIHWTNARQGHVGEAMVGGFTDGRGLFYNTEIFEGRPVQVRFVFSDITASTFRLEQAFSADDGASWEANWIATFARDTVAGEGDGHDNAATLWMAIDDAWNARDAPRFASLFTEDAIMVFFDREETLSGRDAIRDAFTERFPQIAAQYAHRSAVTRVRAVAHGVLVVDGTVDVVRHMADPMAEPETFRSFRVSSVMVHAGNAWRFRDMRIHPSP
ncbi:SgcJ/EcaC family oxidoreductase [Luteimonas sp. SJ-92]|uniref:SgcJ/EcaC family oxidoreductase n=1 Tax=Luteimonas salinisoli TaxID=2752307 RepID=A0A853JBL1_9GAMM|nr:SgcJ/EcaC family oxidoreductase [Luteimonas salinisoli]NZA26225.1 SgcJ/EcaC family oxidoreductase [Luteimonas salinisoli]